MRTKRIENGGFTLLEILLALSIMAVIAVFSISLANSVSGGAKVRETKSKMTEISVKARAYYRNKEVLPAATGSSGTDLPVDAAAGFNMEQTYRYDAWGQPFRYYITLSGSILDIDAFTVNGKVAGGVLISAGPDQAFSTTGGYGTNTVATTEDDIVIPLDVLQEAMEIAVDELRVLQDKAIAFDAYFAGIDNGGAAGVDEDNCAAMNPAPTIGAGCDVSFTFTGATADPNCGSATLDVAVTSGPCGVTSENWAVYALTDLYKLGDKYRLDPWGNYYNWGDDGGLHNFSQTGEPRYHKFFSKGPDGAAGADTTPGDDLYP